MMVSGGKFSFAYAVLPALSRLLYLLIQKFAGNEIPKSGAWCICDAVLDQIISKITFFILAIYCTG